MIDKVRQDAEALRCFSVEDCIDFPKTLHTCLNKAADLIESLAAELEQVKRERDAAVEDMAGICRKRNVCDGCKNDDAAYISNDCMDCANACNWQWRGVKED